MNHPLLSIDRFKFKEIHNGGLFEPNWLESLKKKVCPYCSRKLHLLRNGRLYICQSKTCPSRVNLGKSFIVNKEKVDIYK